MVVAGKGNQPILVAPGRTATGADPIRHQPLGAAVWEIADKNLALSQLTVLLARHADKGQPRALIAPLGLGVVALAIGHLNQVARGQIQHPDLHEAILDPTRAVELVAQATHDFDCGRRNAGTGAAVSRAAHGRPAYPCQARTVSRPVEAAQRFARDRVDRDLHRGIHGGIHGGIRIGVKRGHVNGSRARCLPAKGQLLPVAAPGQGACIAVALGQAGDLC